MTRSWSLEEEQEIVASYEFMLRDLGRSGLDEQVIEHCQTYLPVSKEYTARTYGVRATSYEISYADPYTGEITDHARLRVQRSGIGYKYKQEKGSGNRLYFPNTLEDTWASVLKAPVIPEIIITEGEKKADAVCAHWNIPCIGLPGVCGWSAGKSRPLRDWDIIDWRRVETVTICFDTDADQAPQLNASKDSVQQQALNVARLLIRKGCKSVKQVHLPLPKGADKVGLDDFIVSYM